MIGVVAGGMPVKPIRWWGAKRKVTVAVIKDVDRLVTNWGHCIVKDMDEQYGGNEHKAVND